MAIYQTGSVNGVSALLDALRAFALARGWTIHSYTTDGAGYRLHIQLGSAHFTFRSMVNESIPNAASSIYGIFGYGATGYAGGSGWLDQPGAPKYGTSPVKYPYSGMVGFGSAGTPSPALTYHFFSVDRNNAPKTLTVTGATNASPIVISATGHRLATGDRVAITGVGGNTAANGTFTITKVNANSFSLDGSTGNGAYTSGGSAVLLAECIYAVVEYPAGEYQRILFGTLDKSACGEVAGGQFMTGSTGTDQNVPKGPVNFFGRGALFGVQGRDRAPSMVYATVDGLTGWKLGPGDSQQALNGQQMNLDTVMKSQNFINCGPNEINSQFIAMPLGVAVTRDGTNNYVATTPWSLIGYLPEIYVMNIRSQAPAAECSISSTTFRTFPMYKKSDNAFNIFLLETQHMGFIIRSN